MILNRWLRDPCGDQTVMKVEGGIARDGGGHFSVRSTQSLLNGLFLMSKAKPTYAFVMSKVKTVPRALFQLPTLCHEIPNF
ncbi:hypothetical protein V6N13_086090 [Hibiscus sabdariffa]|uniref:Uncharacterized protein n=1 Tax=Hibiscus sabdariffa TaxID=183260 RepID=A0ABR2FS92_9ROSI